MFETSTMLPRHAFSARDAARAGDVWRLFQEIAVEASTAGGWPPSRYREERTAFVVRSMLVRHRHEITYGEPLSGTTWVARMRREMLSTRELRLRSLDPVRGLVASARQEWVHVSESLQPERAPRTLLDAFPEERAPDGDVDALMPSIVQMLEPHAPHVFTFRAWWTSMDPLDHVNHPGYVDFCDEAIAVAAHAAGLTPLSITPLAEELTFRSGVVGGDEVRVESVARGLTEEGAAVIAHRILVGDRLCASGTTVRRLIDASGPTELVRALREPIAV